MAATMLKFWPFPGGSYERTSRVVRPRRPGSLFDPCSPGWSYAGSNGPHLRCGRRLRPTTEPRAGSIGTQQPTARMRRTPGAGPIAVGRPGDSSATRAVGTGHSRPRALHPAEPQHARAPGCPNRTRGHGSGFPRYPHTDTDDQASLLVDSSHRRIHSARTPGFRASHTGQEYALTRGKADPV